MSSELQQTGNHDLVVEQGYRVEDAATGILNHKEFLALCGKAGAKGREKAILLLGYQLGGQSTLAVNLAKEQRSAPDRLARMLIWSKIWNTGSEQVYGDVPEATKATAWWERFNAQAALPVIAAIALGLAAWKTGEVLSWKSVSEAHEKLTGATTAANDKVQVANTRYEELLQRQLEALAKEKKDLQDKVDAIQEELTETLKKAADSKDVAALQAQIAALNEKLRGLKQPPPATTAQTTAAHQ